MGGIAASRHLAMSLHLTRTLDEIGLNTLTVKRRRNTYLCIEQMRNVCCRLTGENWTSYHFGSQTEGATTPGLKSDVDTLFCSNSFNVIEDWVHWKPGQRNLLMLQEHTAPGYCRLQLLQKDVPMGRDDLPSDDNYAYDDEGRNLLKNKYFYSISDTQLFDRNGPAETGHGGTGFLDYDYVCALLCRNWPGQAEEFIKRRRRHGWPSYQLVEEATRHGVFLVPVGHKLSQTEPLEWRISASLAERHLMFSLSIVHIKCYVVLKILMKSFVEPRIENCISSYHCKTALLYCTENTETGFWREDNLLPCVIKCLEMLRDWVADLFCPHFMIKDENLFAGKVTEVNRHLLLSILTELIESDGRVLLRVSIDDLGQKLQTKMNTEPSRIQLTCSLTSVMLAGVFELDKQLSLNDRILQFNTYHGVSDDRISAARAVFGDIRKLQEMAVGSGKYERQVIQSYIKLLSCWLGSLMASNSLAQNKSVPYEAIWLICTAAQDDVSSILKLGSVFYCSGQFSKAESMLKTVEEIFGTNVMKTICNCFEHKHDIHYEFCHKMYQLKSEKARTRLFAHCVRFSRHEIHCAPSALHKEMYRAVGDDMEHRDPDNDVWMDLAVVDCLPYLYYLQYLTYKQLGKHDFQKRSLRNLERCVREVEYLPHRETAWNLLGQCWESEQQQDAAMNCYRTSLLMRQRNNAANLHIQRLA